MTIKVKAALDLGGNAVGSVADPVQPQDAATKNYVDTRPAGNEVTIANDQPSDGSEIWVDWDEGELTSAVVPTGGLMAFAGGAAPVGWLLCDGAAVSRTTYAALFAVLGTAYGAGDGSTTFNLPNMKGRVAAGLDAAQTEFNTRGKTGGEKSHVQTVAEMPSHGHTISAVDFGPSGMHHQSGQGGRLAQSGQGFGGQASPWPNVDATGNGNAFNVLQPYLTMLYIIKT